MLKTAPCWETVVDRANVSYPKVDRFSYKYLITAAAEQYPLPPDQVNFLGRYLNLRLFPRPSGVPQHWRYIICKSYLAKKYLSSVNSKDYVVGAPPSAIGYRPSVIHRTKMGYVDPSWFCELVPELEKIAKGSNLGKPFSEEFNFAVRSLCENSRGGLGMTEG